MKHSRNIAIIAHVDHGKTTLVDELLKLSGAFRENQQVTERAMDSNEIERERGITILAKCTSLDWKDHTINIVDTPGHADFGGEVERILNMVDGVLLLVDAAEGPMPQTKFVLTKALKLGLKPIVVVNKVDRSDARPLEVLEEIFDLFVALDANDDQLDFPIFYASGRDGWAVKDLDDPREDLSSLLDGVCETIPAPKVEKDKPFAMLVTLIESDPYLGRILTGRVQRGSVKTNQAVKALDMEGNVVEQGRINKIMIYKHLSRVGIDQAIAGDIISIAGLEAATVTHTICDPEGSEPIQAQPIDPSTMTMTFAVNDSPLAGREGDKVTSRLIRDRLLKEAESNVAIQVSETESREAFEVAARGELQLAVLIENMRREGFELSISRPKVVFHTDPNTGEKTEPYEEVLIDVDEEFSGIIMEKMGLKKAEMKGMQSLPGGKARLTFEVPSRCLIGYHGEFLTDTRGTGVMSRVFSRFGPYKGEIQGRRNGVLISTDNGAAIAYALNNLEERGIMFVNPGDQVYTGMIIGENSRHNDLEVNPLKAKQLTNIRAAGKDDAVRLTPPRLMTLEDAITYIDDDERVEVTPTQIRLRKSILNPHDRKRASRTKE